ncbi:hypothetical protein XFF6970_290007 [Xanthomonas citri pv. fuscans]|nr:hypothetical protein XFF6970_290007 [Xanthomonas citri pv. fuscans]
MAEVRLFAQGRRVHSGDHVMRTLESELHIHIGPKIKSGLKYFPVFICNAVAVIKHFHWLAGIVRGNRLSVYVISVVLEPNVLRCRCNLSTDCDRDRVLSACLAETDGILLRCAEGSSKRSPVFVARELPNPLMKMPRSRCGIHGLKNSQRHLVGSPLNNVDCLGSQLGQHQDRIGAEQLTYINYALLYLLGHWEVLRACCCHGALPPAAPQSQLLWAWPEYGAAGR